jgi:hypothetical protein
MIIEDEMRKYACKIVNKREASCSGCSIKNDGRIRA